MNYFLNKRLVFTSIFCFISTTHFLFSQKSISTEGLWLPEQLPQISSTMNSLGNTLKSDQIYSENTPSIKDAVVRLNNGQCTGSIISASGLMLSNHHCLLESLPNIEVDNWREGFWAQSIDKEVPIPELNASILVRTEDVTQQVIGPSMEDYAGIEARKKEIVAAATNEQLYTAEVLSFHHGREYRLFVYLTYTDVRLVGLPSNQLARWGYGPEEWDWPRYGADFSLLRIYTDAEGMPAAYSEENIPLKPKKHLSISLENRKEDDFSMVLGYPGATNRYISARGLKHIIEEYNPDRIDLLNRKAGLISQLINDEQPVELAISDEYQDIARTASYYKGQIDMLDRFDVLAQKEQREMALRSWIFKDPKRQQKYGNVLADIDSLYEGFKKYNRFVNMLYTGLLASEASSWSLPFLFRIKPILDRSGDSRSVQRAMKPIRDELSGYYENFHPVLDQQIFYQGLVQFYQKVDPSLHPRILRKILSHKSTRKGENTEERLQLWVNYAYENSVLTDKGRMRLFVQNPELSVMKKDPIFEFIEDIVGYYRQEIALEEAKFSLQLDIRNRLYDQAINEMTRKQLYPDANTSLRISYGKIGGYEPQDAIIYEPFCHFSGMVYEQTADLQLPPELLDAWENKDLGNFSQGGKLPVTFLTNNDISAGNSGSPVIDAKGHLIGCIFDANREAMSSDYQYNLQYQRALSVDIRFIVWITKYLGKADYLLDEMEIE